VSFLVLFLLISIYLYFRAQCTCEDPLTPLESELSALPKFIPIYWFDPGYWNTILTVHCGRTQVLDRKRKSGHLLQKEKIRSKREK